MKMIAKPTHLWHFEKYEITPREVKIVFEIEGFQWNSSYFPSIHNDWNHLLQIKFIRDSITPYLEDNK